MGDGFGRVWGETIKSYRIDIVCLIALQNIKSLSVFVKDKSACAIQPVFT